MSERGTGLYIHIPFCAVKCRFCHFATYPGLRREIPAYLNALRREIQSFGPMYLETLYVGGGSPTILDARDLEGVLNAVRNTFFVQTDWEATVECNPESTTVEMLKALRRSEINRLSFGLQATQDSILLDIGRRHDFERFREVFFAARGMGFDNLNVDLIYGLPGQTLSDWKDTLDLVLGLGPEHVSAYALDVEERTAFERCGIHTDDDLQADMYGVLADRLGSEGYRHYEISNFARPGRSCRHNERYWKNLETLGAGVSAASYRDGARRQNTDSVKDYVESVNLGRPPVVEETVLRGRERIGEELMLSLRLDEGARVSGAARKRYGPALDRFRDLGFLSYTDGDRARLNRAGWLVSNQLFREFI